MADLPERFASERFFTPLDELEIEDFPGFSGRRSKAALTLSLLWGATIVLHLVSWGTWLVLGLTAILSTHALRILLTRPVVPPAPLPPTDYPAVRPTPEVEVWEAWPYVSLLVAAKNEETVIEPLVTA
ncbi:glycosyl transferase, partial [filamentous cyanobacterium CCP4]